MKFVILVFILVESTYSVGDLPTIWKTYPENGTRFTVEFELFCPWLENRHSYYFGTDLCEFDSFQKSNFLGRTEGQGFIGTLTMGLVHGHQESDQHWLGNGWEIMINVHHNCTFDGRMTCNNAKCADCYYSSEECHCKLSVPLLPHSEENSCHVDLDSPCDW